MTPSSTLPIELIYNVIELIAIRERNTQMQDLKSCSLTAKLWTRLSQRYILKAITIPFDRLLVWASEIDPARGVLSHVRMLTLRGGKLPQRLSPSNLAKLQHHLAAFNNLECLNLKEFCLHSRVKRAELVLDWFSLFGGKLKTLNLMSCVLSPNAFQSIVYIFPRLDNVSIVEQCRLMVKTEDDITLKPLLRDRTDFRGTLETENSTPQEFLSRLTGPLHFHRLACPINKEGYRIITACAATLQELSLEGTSLHVFLGAHMTTNIAPLVADEGDDYIEITPTSFPELHTLRFWIGEWEEVGPMVHHYFPLVGSAPNLSTIHVDVNEETKDTDGHFLKGSLGWKEVDAHLSRLTEGARSPMTLVLESPSLQLPLHESEFLPKFLEAGGLIQFK